MRECGILLHITSLPSKYGAGCLGEQAFKFVDFLKKSGQRYWQILPIGPTGYGDSPYQCYSAFAGNPLLIDLEALTSEGLISKSDPDYLAILKKRRFNDFSELIELKTAILSKASRNFFENEADDAAAYDDFCSSNSFWLDDYAFFMSVKQLMGGKSLGEWDDGIRLRAPDALERYGELLSEKIEEWKFIQYVFFAQYFAVKKYANENGIKIYGDMPIYVSPDSSDLWAGPELFALDADRRPSDVAGCPPDSFAPKGQLWGNPLYNWDYMNKDGYKWWISRIEYSAKLFDLTRIDHFRGFESYYAIPAADKTAENGRWLKGPSSSLFRAVKEALGDVSLVAEDLGFLTEDVEKMLKETGYPGMNVLEFAFYGMEDSGYLPHNHKENSVTYIGTHDNDTAVGWYNSLGRRDKTFAKRYMGLNKKEGAAYGMIRTAYSSASKLVIIQMQDFLELDSKSRMNIPSTVGGGNWLWRLGEDAVSRGLAKKIRRMARTYFRSSI